MLLLSDVCFTGCKTLLVWQAAVSTEPGTSHNLKQAVQPRCSPWDGLSTGL